METLEKSPMGRLPLGSHRAWKSPKAWDFHIPASPAAARPPLRCRLRADEDWTMDFTEDALASGRKFRTLNLMDGYKREALWLEADTSLPGARVVRVLAQPRETRRMPEPIQVDHGPEFISQAVDQRAFGHNVEMHIIASEKPTENAFIDSFNGRSRDECLNENWFMSLEEARMKIEAWRKDYNQVRPHSALGYQTPQEFAGRGTAPPTPLACPAEELISHQELTL
ncbi:MAG: transposase [Acidobacteria bacterium]|nr:transposase [Acidobacteriota bacterium]